MNRPRLEPEIEKRMIQAAKEDIKRRAEKHSGFLLAALLVLATEVTNSTGHLDDAISLAKEALGKVLGDDIDVVMVEIIGGGDDDA